MSDTQFMEELNRLVDKVENGDDNARKMRFIKLRRAFPKKTRVELALFLLTEGMENLFV